MFVGYVHDPLPGRCQGSPGLPHPCRKVSSPHPAGISKSMRQGKGSWTAKRRLLAAVTSGARVHPPLADPSSIPPRGIVQPSDTKLCDTPLGCPFQRHHRHHSHHQHSYSRRHHYHHQRHTLSSASPSPLPSPSLFPFKVLHHLHYHHHYHPPS